MIKKKPIGDKSPDNVLLIMDPRIGVALNVHVGRPIDVRTVLGACTFPKEKTGG